MNTPVQSVLYVEDDADTRDFVTYLLKAEGYAVTTTEDGQHALNLVRTWSFDLYMIDNWLPDMTGIKLCQKLRAVDPSTPILFYSGSVELDEQENALACGAQGYLTKPASIEDLLTEVRRLIRSN